jgi:hypothetical protein
MNFDRADFATNRLLRQDLSPVAEQTASIVKKRGSSTSQGKRPSEAGVQSAFVSTARDAGYMHLRTSRVRRPCSECGKVDHRGDGCSLGLPDEFLRRPWWPSLLWAGVEIKGPTTPISTEQQALADEGAIIIAHGWDDVEPSLRWLDELLAGVMPPEK